VPVRPSIEVLRKRVLGIVEGAKRAFQKMGRGFPDVSGISPTMIGAPLLSFEAPPMMEEAFGYRGALGFCSIWVFAENPTI
jgi:hypothetical protein